MILIKIDKSTIKKNPNVGNMVTYVNGITEHNFSGEGEIPEALLLNHRFIITNFETENNEILSYNGIIQYLDSDLLDFIRDNNIKIKINTKLNHRRIDHFPEQKYFYKYENPDITCKYCNGSFKYDELVYRNSDDWFISKDPQCPLCVMGNCCEIEYEKIENIIK